jgi:hypothetical protein
MNRRRISFRTNGRAEMTDGEFRAALRNPGSQRPGAAAIADRSGEALLKHLDELLDKALEESFPASDSPSVGNSR